MYKVQYLLVALLIFSCKSKKETLKPTVENISSSIYASGLVKTKNQYQVFANVNGIIDEIFVSEGDMVKKECHYLLSKTKHRNSVKKMQN